MSQSGKESWGARLGVIMAVMGSAVGLGNFLRFPGLAAQYEGAAFMIPYFIALLVLGLPLAWGEWAMGRFGGARGYNSAAGIFRTLWKRPFAPYFGVLGCLVPVGIYMYYILIESWCLGYAWHYLSGTMATVGHQAALAGGKLDKAPLRTALRFIYRRQRGWCRHHGALPDLPDHLCGTQFHPDLPGLEQGN